jgi:hypothetical protein
LNNNYLSSKSVTYVSVDIECSGPIPAEYSMLSLGACVVGNEENNNNKENDYTFYIEIQPLSDNYVKDICVIILKKSLMFCHHASIIDSLNTRFLFLLSQVTC